MEEMIERLTALFSEAFPGSRCEIDTRGDTQVGGFLIWDGFEGKTMEERHRLVWGLLRRRLTHDEVISITAIFTQSENEFSIMLEESEAV